MSLWMLQTETSHLWKVRYAIILLSWQYIYNFKKARKYFKKNKFLNKSYQKYLINCLQMYVEVEYAEDCKHVVLIGQIVVILLWSL